MQVMRSSLYGAAVVLVLLSPWAMASAADGRRYESIFCFGDSFTDTGNNPAVFAWYSVVDPVTRPPYGSSFFGHPTGRNCDGRLIVDFIAEGLGLPYVPPYLGPPFGSPPAAAAAQGFRQGASLAVGAATAIDVGFFHERGLVPAPSKFPLNTSLTVQLQWFDSLLKPTLCGTTQGTRSSQQLAASDHIYRCMPLPPSYTRRVQNARTCLADPSSSWESWASTTTSSRSAKWQPGTSYPPSYRLS
ncbi:hypothetical protein HU200_014839 [Digitaria exilis]|uniref:GDSL esterase/lipase n=1 Tax=Digitaria exilis TaxID=1010633 RepID=A0A835FAS8_9POAL|nr:hypothetical protein HU200_014839 [Digitaria exilis]